MAPEAVIHHLPKLRYESVQEAQPDNKHRPGRSHRSQVTSKSSHRVQKTHLWIPEATQVDIQQQILQPGSLTNSKNVEVRSHEQRDQITEGIGADGHNGSRTSTTAEIYPTTSQKLY